MMLLIVTLVAFLFLMLALGLETLLRAGHVGDPQRARGCASCSRRGCGCDRPERDRP